MSEAVLARFWSTPIYEAGCPPGTVALVVADPLAGWAQAAALFHPVPTAEAGIHPSAVVAETAIIDPSAEIGALAHIGAQAVIGSGVVLGPDCHVGSNASISHAVLGARVYIYPGARIG